MLGRKRILVKAAFYPVARIDTGTGTGIKGTLCGFTSAVSARYIGRADIRGSK